MRSRLPLRLAQAVFGTVLGLALAEGMFWLADDGAFAHVNFYVPDASLGVRLAPGATERIAFGGNPVTSVRVNAAGYRGADWGAPQAGEIVVVGDSQVFGLGVEEDQTASAVLGEALGRPVINAGVPTYGPVEYLAVIEELLVTRKPATVVLVLNFSNDLFEKDTPNTQRHAVWDGWAVRLETAPDSVVNFPGRSWLMSQSHLVLAARRAWWTPPEAWDQGVASEGTWDAVAKAAQAPLIAAAAEADARAAQVTTCQTTEHTSPEEYARCREVRLVAEHPEAGRPEAALAREVNQTASNRLEAEYGLVQLYRELFLGDQPEEVALALEAAVDNAHPGDIVTERYAESSRGVAITAEQLKEGARMRAELDTRLAKWAEEHAGTDDAERVQAELSQRRALDTTLSALATRVADELDGRSPLLDVVEAANARCAVAGAELVVVALPLDVQVSDTEWAKYGLPVPAPGDPLDMASTRVLLTDLVRNAATLGLRALDATAPLAAAQPGAFLNADLHMSPKGQAALGTALATLLQSPRPLPRPGIGLPPGRTRVPTLEELALGKEVVVRGSTKNHCSTRSLREWLIVDCTPRGEPGAPLDVVPVSGSEILTGRSTTRAVLVAPLVRGRDLAADFVWEKQTERLTVTWEGDKPRMAFVPTPRPTIPPPPACVADLASYRLEVADLTRGCATSFPDDCTAQFACGSGTRAPLPTCTEGQANAGSAGHCYPLCDDAHPCATGVCSPWQGAGVCM